VRFSVFTVSLPEWTPEEAVEHLAALGYDGVEWRVVDQPPSDGPPGFWSGNRCTLPLRTIAADASRVRALAAGVGLAVPNLGTYVSCLDADAVDRGLAAAVALEAPSIRVQVPNYDGREPYLPLRDTALTAFDEVARLAAARGVRALVEIHMGTIVPSASAAAQFCSRFDPDHVGVIHDAGNMVFEGYERYRMGLEVLGPYLAHVHLKNARWAPVGAHDDGTVRWAAAFAPLGEGSVDLRDLLRALRAVGYDGWISFEDFSTDRPLRDRTRANLETVRAILAATS
jgi:sugar phosphate isomerase/epimerase